MDSTIDAWLAKLADRTPTPGGGAAAALLAATSAALIGMVTSYTTGPKWSDREARMKELNTEASALRTEALVLIGKDEAAFAAVGEAYGMPKDTPEQKSSREHAIQQALTAAAGPPQEVARLTARLVEMAKELAPAGNPNVISDVAVATTSARAALEAAIVNIEINQSAIKDKQTKQNLGKAIEKALKAMEAADYVTLEVRKKFNQ